MSNSTIGEVHDCALESLEKLEIASLSWGYVDGSLSEIEAESAIAGAMRRCNFKNDPGEVLDDLVDAKLVRLWRGPDRRYRTRFGEIVRLLVRSKQLFKGRDWQTAPTLVSDFRVDVRRRARPRPEINPECVLTEISSNKILTARQRDLWTVLTSADSGFKLRKFQSDAAKRILGNTDEQGTIVTAGTGSGKTLAFYLPILTAIGEGVKPGDTWTRALCIYPRRELLKDQFNEAYNLCQKAKQTLYISNRRPISLGALFGGIPYASNERAVKKANWKKSSAGFISPVLRCPDCDADMVWHPKDLAEGIERLHCTSYGCGLVTDRSEIRLTRQSMLREQPDLLFTTTEMLNQRLSDTSYRRLFGVGRSKDKRLQFILLDEVHTYSGTNGAQTALLLRRLKHLVASKLHWVGLSATLKEAPLFFSELCGLQPKQVAEITPTLQDLDHTGGEYQLLIRSDPTSQTATLSTSIQASMLISRMLDSPSTRVSEGRFGTRLFAFTDDLDVTHRLFDNLRDAEACDRFGRRESKRQPLAFLRSENLPDSEAREIDGQRWNFAEEIQGSLDHSLVIGRTTSRDPGVNGRANVIVATTALEVGFNDSEVGAVLQHKAPRSFASFLQRRGRAGRGPNMRPLTITVLSDYGRDRLAFQSFEYLFEPVLERQSLPIGNSYVLRMQAVFSTLDWITHKLVSNDKKREGWAWRVLSGSTQNNSSDRKFLNDVKEIIRSLIQLEQHVISDLSEHLQASLQIPSEVLHSVLWDPPRSLLLEALPTLARRLFRDWKLADGTGYDLMVPYHPLPDFIPHSLFSDLNLPQVTIQVPAATRNSQIKYEQLPILQAINQFAPGRVRRRFADEYGGLAHWLPVPEHGSEVEISVEELASQTEVVATVLGVSKEGTPLNVYRPWNMELQKVPSGILHSSHSAWAWQSSFEFIGDPYIVELPKRSFWSKTLPHLEFFLHRFSTAATQRRFALEGQAEIRRRSGVSNVKFRLVDCDGCSAAVGFAYDTDALLVPLNLPQSKELSLQDLPEDLTRWLRTLHFRRAVLTDCKLPKDLNSFQRDWLYQVFLLSVVRRANQDCVEFEKMTKIVASKADATSFKVDIEAIINAEVLGEKKNLETKLSKSLFKILGQSNVINRMSELALQSCRLIGEMWEDWILEILRNTMAEAALLACFRASPGNTTLEGLTVDIVGRNKEFFAHVAETTLGGGGTVEALAHQFSADPRSFLRAYEAALAPTDLETSADSLELICRLAVSDEEAKSCIECLRRAPDVQTRIQERDKLFKLLSERGIPVSHALSVSIAVRLLRPGATADSDELIVDMLDQLVDIENQVKFALPFRVAAAVLASRENLKDRLVSIGEGRSTAIGVANLLLWPRKGELRMTTLQSYNPYRTSHLTDTLLARVVLVQNQIEPIMLDTEDWHNRISCALASDGEAILCAHSNQTKQLRVEIVNLISRSIETEHLRFFPCLAGLKREKTVWSAKLFVREFN